MIRAVLFDMDGVLVDTEPVHEEARRRTYARHNIPYEQIRDIPVIGRNTDAIFADVHARIPFPVPLSQAIREKRDIFVSLLGDSVQLLPGVRDLLEYFRGTFKLALVTSSARQNVQAVLRGACLESAFDAVIAAEDVTRWKPDPESFLVAAQKLGVLPGECMVFEDSPLGVEAAKAAGMKVVGVRTGQGGKSPKQADLLVRDLKHGRAAVLRFIEEQS